MKKLFLFAAVVLLVSCNSAETETTTVDRAIGFNTMLPELQWHLGTEEAIKVVKDLDKVWAAQDYEAMKAFFADTAKCMLHDGRTANSPQEFVDLIKEDDEGNDVSWTFDYAYSVDLDPSKGGEHVQAGFTGTSVQDGVESKKHYHESYYVVEGKIVMYRQYTIDIVE